MSNNVKTGAYLIAKKVPVDLKDKQGQTALHWAARYGRKEIAKQLIAAGADIYAADKQGKTPLEFALQPRPFASANPTADSILGAVKDANVKLAGGQYPIHFAARYGLTDAVKAATCKGRYESVL